MRLGHLVLGEPFIITANVEIGRLPAAGAWATSIVAESGLAATSRTCKPLSVRENSTMLNQENPAVVEDAVH